MLTVLSRYGASIFGHIIVNVSKSINEEKQVFCGCNISHVSNTSNHHDQTSVL